MKNTYKIISVLVLCMVLISSFCVEIFADTNAPLTSPSHEDTDSIVESDDALVVSEDYKALSYKGYTFTIVDPAFRSLLSSVHNNSRSLNCEILFSSDDQLNSCDSISSFVCKTDDNIPFYINLIIYFNNGHYETLFYLNTNYVKELASAVSGNYTDAYILSNNKVYTEKWVYTSHSNIPTLPSNIYHSDLYPVYSYSENFEILQGYIYKTGGGSYYYFDLSENGFTVDKFPALMNVNSIQVYTIMNKELISLIEAPASSPNFSDDDFVNSDAMGIISIVLMTLACGIVPLIAAIFCYIKAAKSGAPYKAMLLAVAIICTVVVVSVALIIAFSLI